MVVLMLVATRYCVLQLAVLGLPARSVRATTLLAAVATGVRLDGEAMKELFPHPRSGSEV